MPQCRSHVKGGFSFASIVVNISALLSGDMRLVEEDVRQVVEVAGPYGVKVKAIIEVYFLTDEQKRTVAIAAERAGAAFIKTSTGTRPDRKESVAADVRLLRAILKPGTAIKASGGVYDLDAVLAYYDAGARRFGASETAAILEDLRSRIDEGVLTA